MKTIDIMTRDMHQLHGANKVTEKLILGRAHFLEHGLELRYVFSQDGIIDCRKPYQSTLGTQLANRGYQRKRKWIETLKKIPLYRTKMVQKRLIEKEITANSRVLRLWNETEEKPDLLIFQDPFTAIYFMETQRQKVPSIFISHADTDPLEQLLMTRSGIRGTSAEREIRSRIKALFCYVDRVVTICKSSQNYMEEAYGIHCPCIINGIEDIERKTVRKYSSEDGHLHIAIVASVQYRKGQDLAVKALASLKEQDQKRIKLHIIGGGSGFDEIKALITELHLEECVTLYGPILDVGQYLPQMDLFLLPSRADTVPIAVIEAMRAGLPVFASDVGEIAEMIQGCGSLIHADVNSIRELYEGLLRGKYNLTELGIASRTKFLKEFQLSAMIDQYSLVLQNL